MFKTKWKFIFLHGTGLWWVRSWRTWSPQWSSVRSLSWFSKYFTMLAIPHVIVCAYLCCRNLENEITKKDKKAESSTRSISSQLRLISPGCPRPNSALIVQKSGLKHCSSIHPSTRSLFIKNTTIALPHLMVYIFFCCRNLENEITEEDTKAQIISKKPDFNENYCMRCFSRFFLIFNPKVKNELVSTFLEALTHNTLSDWCSDC